VSVADEFVFATPLSDWKPSSTSALEQTVDVGASQAGVPSQLRFDLSAPGFSAYFPDGIDLVVGTIGSPILSWSEGSVENSVSTPPSPWVLVTFRQGEPPVLFSFPDAPQAMIVDGAAGKWHLRTIGKFSGWVRLLLPFGLESRSAVTAGSLGDLVKRLQADGEIWTGAAPRLVDSKVTSDATSVTATWTFDKAGALVPQSAIVAGYGGYPLHLLTKTSQLEGSSDEGPMAITREPKLSIRFPVASWPSCRYMAFPDAQALPAPSGKLEVSGAVDVAFRSLSSDFSPEMNSAAGTSLMSYLSTAGGDLEPYSGQRFPYAAAGEGYDLAAAHALLTQSLAVLNGSATTQNPLLSEVIARVDAYTWQPWAMDESTWRRASALAAIACAMRGDDASRLQGAMLQAGLSAQRGLDLWHYWRGDITKLPSHLEVMENLRRALFALQGATIQDPVVDELFSPIRFCGSGQLQITEQGIRWLSLDGSPGQLQLMAPVGTKMTPGENLQSMNVTGKNGTFLIRYVPSGAGFCSVKLSLPAAAKSIPTAVGHSYVEASR